MAKRVRKVRPGKPFPLGATWDGEGVNFALYANLATRVELCLFDTPFGEEFERLALREITNHIWHIYLHGLGPGQLYGFRVHGPYEPEQGLRFNANKLLIDPYARAITGKVNWKAPVFGYPLGDPDADLAFDPSDSAWGMPKACVTHPYFDWQSDHPPRIPWNETVIYEAHVRGFSTRNPDVPPEERGTYAGLAAPASIEYLKRLGVTAVELLPVHESLDDKRLVDRGLRNYWGYQTVGYFAPDGRYSSSGDTGGQVNEFKRMVRELHRAGIEVILDVVFNHSAEGNELGPTLSFRGIDNPTYYKLVPGQERYYQDYTGTGNSLNVEHPQVLKLIMDSLRYWIQEMHVDGFRFDLASTLGREQHDVDLRAAFFDIIHQDPIISQVKLIAEPWDLGEGGYQVGNFPAPWSEWNDRYRDAVRRYWRGDEVEATELADRLTGSPDLYVSNGRRPSASINFVTAHDGFTLRDLVSYNEKHNEANGEDNRDGADENFSWNCGVEGPTDDPEINGLRAQQQRNFLATLLLSHGVPMLCGGDEIGRTQLGNNNAYCQDSEVSWFNWQLTSEQESLRAFTQRLIALRRAHPVLHPRTFVQEPREDGTGVRVLTWLTPDGEELSEPAWEAGWRPAIGMRLAGDAIDEVDDLGGPISDDTLLVLLNAYAEPVPFQLPAAEPHGEWECLLDTAQPDVAENVPRYASGATYELEARSLALLRRSTGSPPDRPIQSTPLRAIR